MALTKVKGSVWDSSDNGLAVSIKDFGADPAKSASENTAAIQAAIDYVVNNPFASEGVVYFPAGSYSINKITVSFVSINKRLRLQGSHKRSELVSNVIGDRTFDFIDAQDVAISGLKITGNGLAGISGNGHALALSDSVVDSGTYFPAQCDITDCDISGFRGNDVDDDGNVITACGIYIGAGLANYITRCKISACSHGIFFYQTQNSHILSCVIDDIDKWPVRFEKTREACSVSYSDLVGSGKSLGVYSETIIGQTAPYGGVLVNQSPYSVFMTGNKFKNGPAAVTSILAQQVIVDKNHIRPESKNSNGFAGIYSRYTKDLTVTNNNIFYVGGVANYEGINAYASQNTEEMKITITDNTFDHGGTVDDDILINGNSNGNNALVKISGNSFGNALRPATVTNCIRLVSGIYVGEITSNRFLVADTSVITDILDVNGATTLTDELIIEGNSSSTYLTGSITNQIAKSRNAGVASANTDGSGDIVVTHGLVVAPTSAVAMVQGVLALSATTHSVTSTTFKIRVYDATGTPQTATAVNIYWSASI